MAINRSCGNNVFAAGSNVVNAKGTLTVVSGRYTVPAIASIFDRG
jgi:hypothetical protein